MLENASGCKIRVISIVGMGGLGKKHLLNSFTMIKM